MHTLNHTLEKKIVQADGGYLDAQGMRSFEHYVQSYPVRLEAYQLLRDRSAALIIQSLKRLAQSYPELVQKHGPRCQYDMTEVVRYVALSILRDDETFFKEQMMSWLDTILLAHKRQSHCTIAYRFLQDAVNAGFSPTSSTLVYPYLDCVITTLQAHA
jgi:hypothetical protein